MSNPYQTPHLSPPASNKPPSIMRPGVLAWYKVYVLLMGLLYALCCVGSVAMAVFAEQMAEDQAEEFGLRIQGIILAIFCLPVFILFAFGLFTGRSKFGWIWGIVLIAIGMTSGCCLPATIPLLIFWLREDNKAWHNIPVNPVS